MSKYVKNLITEHLRERLGDVHDALLVSMVGLDVNTNNRLRTALQSKGIRVLVVKNSLAARACEGTPLAPMFEGLTGSAAVCWGGEDLVSLAKEVVALAGEDEYEPFEPRGGVMDGERLTPEQVQEVSKWPGRAEQISLLVGQILSPGAQLASQLCGPGGALVSQIESLIEKKEEALPEISRQTTESPKQLTVEQAQRLTPEQAQAYVLSLGNTLLVSCFRDRETTNKVGGQLPQLVANPPLGRKGTHTQLFPDANMPDGTVADVVITGGALTDHERTKTVQLFTDHGFNQIFVFPSNPST